MKPSMVGGQAVIEGVMMKSKDNMAIAVRLPDGSITLHKEKVFSVTENYPILKLPFLRGVIVLFESLILGIRALTFSAQFYEEEASESSFDRFLKRIFGDKLDNILIYFSLFMALLLAVLLFFILPTFVTSFAKSISKNAVFLNFVEGVIRIAIFFLYVLLISKLEDIERVFQYHGAEHKTIHCYEKGEELTVENCKKYSTLHPRCGTSFILIVMVLSILLFSLFKWPDLYVRIVTRVLLLPVIAGVSYELLRWCGRSENIFTKVISAPGLFLQKLTTREPDDMQLEVAICSLKGVLEDESV